jgi:hypothetical protein
MRWWRWTAAVVTLGLTLALPPPMWYRLVNDTGPFRTPGHLLGAAARGSRNRRDPAVSGDRG